MLRTKLTLTVLLFLLAGPFTLPAVGEAPHAGTPQVAQEKAQYEKSMQERLGKLGAQLDELKVKVDAGSAKVEVKVKEHLAEAEMKRKEAALKLEELGKASRGTWQKFSVEMEKAAKDFEQAFERARKRME